MVRHDNAAGGAASGAEGLKPQPPARPSAVGIEDGGAHLDERIPFSVGMTRCGLAWTRPGSRSERLIRAGRRAVGSGCPFRAVDVPWMHQSKRPRRRVAARRRRQESAMVQRATSARTGASLPRRSAPAGPGRPPPPAGRRRQPRGAGDDPAGEPPRRGLGHGGRCGLGLAAGGPLKCTGRWLAAVGLVLAQRGRPPVDPEDRSSGTGGDCRARGDRAWASVTAAVGLLGRNPAASAGHARHGRGPGRQRSTYIAGLVEGPHAWYAPWGARRVAWGGEAMPWPWPWSRRRA